MCPPTPGAHSPVGSLVLTPKDPLGRAKKRAELGVGPFISKLCSGCSLEGSGGFD